MMRRLLRQILPLLHRIRRHRRPGRPDQRIAAPQMQAEPRCLQFRTHGVQPQRNLRQLHRRRIQVHAVHPVQRDRRTHLLHLLGVRTRVDPLTELVLLQLQIQVRQLIDGLHRERTRPHRRLANRKRQHVVGTRNTPRLPQHLDRLAHRELRDHRRRIERRRPLTIPRRLPEHERPRRMPAIPLCDARRILRVNLLDEGILRQRLRQLLADHPGTLRRITLRRDLQKRLLRNETRVRHQALIDLPQLRHAQRRVRDEPAILAPRLAGEQQVLQHLLQGRIRQLRDVDVTRRPIQEQIRRQIAERQPLLDRTRAELLIARRRRRRLVALIDHLEQQVQAVVQVRARRRTLRRRRHQHLLAQMRQAIAVVVLRHTRGQDVQLRRGLGEEQEQNPVQVPQRLLRQLIAVDPVGRQPLRPVPLQNIVTDDLDGLLDRLPQLRRHLHRMVTRLGQRVLPPRRPVRRPVDVLERQRRHDLLQLAVDLPLVALGGQRDVDAQVPAQRPRLTLGHDHPRTGQQDHERRRLIGQEQLRHQLHRRRRLLLAVDRHPADRRDVDKLLHALDRRHPHHHRRASRAHTGLQRHRLRVPLDGHLPRRRETEHRLHLSRGLGHGLRVIRVEHREPPQQRFPVRAQPRPRGLRSLRRRLPVACRQRLVLVLPRLDRRRGPLAEGLALRLIIGQVVVADPFVDVDDRVIGRHRMLLLSTCFSLDDAGHPATCSDW